jgi:hypothetical protein
MFRIDKDRMYVVYSIEDRDLALAFLEMEGMSLCMPGGKQPIRYLTCQGHWEQRISYISKEREKGRQRDMQRRKRLKEERYSLS